MISKIIQGDCIEKMTEMPESSVDAVVTDPPYSLSFMSKSWDSFDTPKEFQEFSQKWGKQAFRVLKPGGYLLAFCGTRTYHRMVVGLENAGFQIKDQIDWLYGQGFPKSHDISKAIDKHFNKEDERKVVGENPNARETTEGDLQKAYLVDRSDSNITKPTTPEAKQWQGWGTALKPSHEPIVVAQKPYEDTYAHNVLTYGVGGLNIDGCRIEANNRPKREVHKFREDVDYDGSSLEGRVDGSLKSSKAVGITNKGRWPANVVLDPQAAQMLDRQSGETSRGHDPKKSKGNPFSGENTDKHKEKYWETGGASRFFYSAKAHKSERNAGLKDLEDGKKGTGNFMEESKWINDPRHPDGGYEAAESKPQKNDICTLKPINLIRWLCKLVTPEDGTVLDPFAGSGTTGCACEIENFNYILIEKRERFAEKIIPKRIEYWKKPKNWSDLKDHKELPDVKEKRNSDLFQFV